MTKSNSVEFEVYKGSRSGKIVQGKTSKPITGGQVLVQVTHSGLCGTDIHYKTSDMVLGHEGVGIVKDVGDKVNLFKPGDRVGWGYEHSCCGHCKQCLRGWETLCPERAMYGMADLDQGSFATHAVWSQNFLFHIPRELDSEFAAPLMCGGATVFNALVQGAVKPTDRVGIMGIGGLGHLAIQFASKMGCSVVVLSGTESKKEEALHLGASYFYATKGVEDIQSLQIPPLDHFLICTSQQPEWSQYLPLLAPGGTVYPLSVSDKSLDLPYMPILISSLRIQGCVVAPRETHMEMLDFAARHGIKPIVQKFRMNVDGIEKAMKLLEDGSIRYRGVLVTENSAVNGQ